MSAINAATRPTRRDLWRHPWRTFAAVILIALPVALVVGFSLFEASSTFNTFLLSPDRSIQVRSDQKETPTLMFPSSQLRSSPKEQPSHLSLASPTRQCS